MSPTPDNQVHPLPASAWAFRPGEAPGLAAEARRLLATSPGDADALLLLALCEVDSGLYDNVVSALDGLVPPEARSAPSWVDVARAHVGAGRPEAAAGAAGFAARLAPELPAAWLLLAQARQALSDEEGVDVALQGYLGLAPRVAALGEARAALEARDPERADRLLRLRLQSFPLDVAAMRMLAEIELARGNYGNAEAILREVLALAPGFDGARQNLAVVFSRGQRHAEALEEVEVLLARDPGNPALQDMKIRLLERAGDVAATLLLHEKKVAQAPGRPERWLEYGHALKTSGRQGEAIAAYRRAIALAPGFGAAWWSIANLKTARFGADDITAMRTQLRNPGLDAGSRVHLEFAAGKALEDAGDFPASFEHYARGNRLHRSSLVHDAEQHSSRTRLARSVYTKDFFLARRGGNPAPDPIFVVGMPRSGSTLVEQILSSHSSVEGTMELPAIIALARQLRASRPEAASYHEAAAALDEGERLELGTRYLERTRVQRRQGRPFFIDKMPNNFAHIGLIQLILPNARIIDVRRHPLACCFSNFKQLFAHGQSFSYDLVELGRYYRDYVELMAHFDAVLPGRIHRVLYEDLVADTETQVGSLLEHCGLPFEEGCLRFFENRRAVRTASSEQVRQPIYREGVDQWRNFEPWLEPLKRALGPVLDAYPAVPA